MYVELIFMFLKNTKLLILYSITLLETIHIFFEQPVEIGTNRQKKIIKKPKDYVS